MDTELDNFRLKKLDLHFMHSGVDLLVISSHAKYLTNLSIREWFKNNLIIIHKGGGRLSAIFTFSNSRGEDPPWSRPNIGNFHFSKYFLTLLLVTQKYFLLMANSIRIPFFHF